MVSQTDGAGRTQNYSYDDKGRLTQRAEGSGKVLASYSYDDKGRINRLTDTSGTTTYQYNSNNQLIEKVQTTEKTVLTTRYHYTQGGQLDEIRYPSGQLAVYQYDKGILKGCNSKPSTTKPYRSLITSVTAPTVSKATTGHRLSKRSVTNTTWMAD
ncbi:hypothetical protein ACGTJS_13235 [Faucicola mancuniensis]